MQPELRYEVLFFYTRDQLERLQPLSTSLLNMIVTGSKALPLRPIHRVFMDVITDNPDAEFQIFVEEEEAGYEPEPDFEASLDDGDFAETFRRLQFTCIKWLDVEIRDSAFMRYWRAQGAAVFTVVNIDFHPTGNTGYIDDADYDLLDDEDWELALSADNVFDCILNHVRPKTALVVEDGLSLHEDGISNEHLRLLARNSCLNSIQTCLLRVRVEGFPPPSFFLNGPGYRKYELWCLHSSAGTWIDGFIESFLRDGCANRKLESVVVHFFEDHQSPAPKQLSKPTKREIPLPKLELMALHNLEVHQVTHCEAHAFDNMKHWQRMDVFKWTSTVQDKSPDSRSVTHVLQCRVSYF